jgi:hypothetical protein
MAFFLNNAIRSHKQKWLTLPNGGERKEAVGDLSLNLEKEG